MSNNRKFDFDRFATECDYWISIVNGPANYLELLKLLPPSASAALDVGCGAGHLALFLADFVDHVTGIDISRAMIERAEQRRLEQQKGNVTFIIADIEDFEVEQASFDFIVSDYALHNTDLPRVLPRLRNLLAPGGCLVVRDRTSAQPAQRRSATWLRWQALKDAPTLLQRHGWRAAFRILRFRLGAAWIAHIRQDPILTPSAALALYRQYFPGASLEREGERMTIIGPAPGPGQESASTAIDQSEHASDVGHRTQPHPLPSPLLDDANISQPFTPASLVEVFEQQVARSGRRTAVRTATKSLTYAQLNAEANRLAWAILDALDDEEEPVAFLLPHAAPILVAIFATLKAGKAYAALNPNHPPGQLAQILQDCQPRLLITDSNRYPQVAEILPKGCQVIVIDRQKATFPTTNPGLSLAPDRMAGLFYTSGSTGQAKGVIRSHGQLLHLTWHDTHICGIRAEDCGSLLNFCGHGNSIPDIFNILLNGASLSLFTPYLQGFMELAVWIQRERITMLHPPVELFRGLVSAIPESMTFPSVRVVRLGAQTVLPQDVEQWRHHFKGRLLHVLASSETGVIAHVLIDREMPIGERVPAGHPAPDKEIMILDEAGNPLPPGEMGEIAVRSRWLSNGYWRKPELTRSKFIADPDGSEARICLTGDIGRINAEGMLEHWGRKDHLVKIRGYRVQLDLVEEALRALPSVNSAAVVARSLPSGGKRLVAYIAPSSSHAPTVSEIRRALSRNLPDYMLPTAWMFLPALPMTASNKVDRRLLPEIDPTRPDLDTPFIAPRTDIEKRIAEVWGELLNINQMGVEDDFFELGGDSLSAMNMILVIEELFDTSVPPVFFKSPTVENLASLLGAGSQP